MSFVVSSAYAEKLGGDFVLIGTFHAIRLDDWQRVVTVAERRPMLAFVAGPPRPVTETIKTHTFHLTPMRDPGGYARFEALRVKPGDPVEWLRGWTWRDPLWLKVWRGEAPDPFKPHIIDLATGKAPRP